MAWYRTGTISVTNGSATITGSGTSWNQVLQPGWAIKAPDGKDYEIAAVISDTSVEFATTYLGTTASGQTYAAMPTSAVTSTLYSSLQTIITSFNALLTGIGVGIFPAGTVGAPSGSTTGDGDTGFYWPAGNNFAIAAAGVQRFLATTVGVTVTGLLSGTAVTQTNVDTTTGRLLKTGDFGLGGLAPIIGNAGVTDNTIAPGIYAYNTTSGSSGGPTGATQGTLHHIRRAVGGGESQLFIAELPTSATGYKQGEVWSRARNTGAWSTWSRVFGQVNILGTVSESSGVPTGALIERGSNANGEYVRFADGLQICTHSMAASSGAAATWTFPAAFIAAPSVAGAAQATVLSGFCLDAAPTTTASTFSARDKTDARRADTCRLMAVGRWF